MGEPRIRVAVILLKEGNILLVRHCKGGKTYWLLPGGGVKFGETLEECAKRELREETNLEVEIKDLVFLSESIPPDGHRHIVNLFFRGEIQGGSLKVKEDEVLREAKFVSFDSLEELVIYPNIKKELKERLLNNFREGTIYLGNRWE